MTDMKRIHAAFWSSLGLYLALGCGGEESAKPEAREPAAAKAPEKKEPAAAQQKAAPASGRALLVTESEFKPNADGKYTVPDAAVLLVLTQAADGAWSAERIEDRESNVFHKALPAGGGGIYTIGANQARLKLWRKADGAWKAETLWSPAFGGEQNRLRDFEAADFDGDGRKDLAIATHDQGVVAVAWNREGGFKIDEIDRKPNTFVHEIEVGDLDGDGKLEIFATPSQPNTASGVGQGGAIVRYAWTGEKFVRSAVATFESRHVKEVLVADMEGDGKPELYGALEAEMGQGGAITAPVEIRRFDWNGRGFDSKKIAELNDRFCRFLVAGDIDRDGATELVASAFSSGVWAIEKEGDGYATKSIDATSGGFEHAAYLADMDGDGAIELYVADDNGGTIERYTYDGNAYQSTVVHRRPVPGQAMVWNITDADLKE
jgi:hypothetical protein